MGRKGSFRDVYFDETRRNIIILKFQVVELKIFYFKEVKGLRTTKNKKPGLVAYPNL
jgi:hypothetical protein